MNIIEYYHLQDKYKNVNDSLSDSIALYLGPLNIC